MSHERPGAEIIDFNIDGPTPNDDSEKRPVPPEEIHPQRPGLEIVPVEKENKERPVLPPKDTIVPNLPAWNKNDTTEYEN